MANNIEFMVGFDGAVLRKNVADSIAELEKFNKSADRMRKSIEDAAGAGNKMKQLQAAVTDLGGVSKLTAGQLEAVQRQLKGLMATGHSVPAEFKSMAASMQAAAASAKTLGAVQGQVAASAQGMASQLGPVGSLLGALGPAGLAAAAGLAAIVGVAGAVGSFLIGAAQSAIAFGSAITDGAAKSGTFVTTFQELKFAASQGGQDVGVLTGAITKMQNALGDSPQAFQKLGLSVADLSTKNPGKAFEDVAAALAKIPNEAARTQAAIDIFGKSGASILPFIQGLEAAQARARELGIVMDEATVAALDRTGDAAAEVSQAWDGMVRNLGAALATTPGLAEGLSSVATALGDLSHTVIENKAAIQDFVTTSYQLFAVLTGAPSSVQGMVNSLKTLTAAVHNVAAGYRLAAEMAGKLVGVDPAAAGGTGAGAAGGAKKKFKQETLRQTSDESRDLRDRAAVAAISARKKAIEDLGKAQQKWWDLQQEFDSKQQSADSAEVKWLAGITGPGVAQVTSDVYKIGQAIKDAGGLSSFSASQIAKISDELQRLKAVSPEGFKEAAAAFGGLVDDAAVDILKTRGNMAQQVKAGLTPAVREIGVVHKQTIDWGKALAGVADMFQVLGISADSALGRILGGVTSVMHSFQQLQKLGSSGKLFGAGGAFSTGAGGGMSTLGGKLAVGGAVGGGLAGLGQMFGGGNTTAGRAFGGAAMGAQLGAVAGPWGMAAGAVVGAIVGAFKKPSWVKVGKEAGKVLGVAVSKELAQAIEKNAKKLGISTKNASLLSITDAMGESGKDPRQFASQITSLMSAIKDGSVPAAQGMQELGESFNAVADAALKAGSVGDRALVGLIKNARDLGIDSPEIKAFVQGQLQGAMAGVGKVIASFKDEKLVGGLGLFPAQATGTQGMDVAAQNGQAQATIFSSVFWASVKELGIVAAADAMREPFDRLKENLTTVFGPEEISKLLGPMQGIMDLAGNDVFRGAVEGAEGLKAALEGVANAGYLTTDSFSAFQQQATSAYEQAVAGGASSAQALQAIAPLLQSLQSASQNYGINLDASTQALIEQAKAAGVAFKTDPVDRMAAGIDRLVVAMEKLAGISHEVADDFHSMVPPIPGAPSPGAPTPRPRDYAEGGFVPARPGGTIIRVGEAGEGEWITPASKSGPGGMGGTVVNVTNAPTINVYGAGNKEEILGVVIDGMRNNDEGLKDAVRSAMPTAA